MRPDTTRPRLRAAFAFLTAAALIVGVPFLLAGADRLTRSPELSRTSHGSASSSPAASARTR